MDFEKDISAMNIVKNIMTIAENAGYATLYGNPNHINEALTDADFGASSDGVVCYVYLITASEVYEGRERADIGIYFASLCEFDFSPRDVLDKQGTLKNAAFGVFDAINNGNTMRASEPRYTYGYDDFADNVCWVCMRITVKELAARCIERNEHKPEPYENDAAMMEDTTMCCQM